MAPQNTHNFFYNVTILFLTGIQIVAPPESLSIFSLYIEYREVGF